MVGPTEDQDWQPSGQSSREPEEAVPLRRSSRVRTRALQAPQTQLNDVPTNSTNDDQRLEQVAYCTADDLGLEHNDPEAQLRVRLHPVAAMLMSVHSHLTKAEVIGYLGGVVHKPAHPSNETHVIVAEAFPARALTARALAKTGRSAYMDVEIDPESSVEVMACIQSKGLEVVGWYHSHPDQSFTVEPSNVDIENQYNYQHLLFREKPFVAAIIAPYNADLPDAKPALEFFRVINGESPMQVPFAVDALNDVPTAVLAEYWQNGPVAPRQYPLATVAEECAVLVEEHRRSPKRVRLNNVWRDEVSFASKLREALLDLIPYAQQAGGPTDLTGNCDVEPVESQVDSFRDCINSVVNHAEHSYALAVEEETAARAARKKRNVTPRPKRSRRR